MNVVKLWTLAALAAFAFGTVGAAAASAEDGPPQILCFVKNCITELEGQFKGGVARLIDLAGREVKSLSESVTPKACKELAGSEGKDGSLCNNRIIDLEGVELDKVKCNTEGDPAGVVLIMFDLHLAAELNAAKTELEPLLLERTLNAKEEFGPVIIKCGIVRIEVKGTLGCLLLPGLVSIPTTKEAEVSCKVNATTHDPEAGGCELLCEWLKEDPFQAKIASAFEDAWEESHVNGKFNKEIFIDD